MGRSVGHTLYYVGHGVGGLEMLKGDAHPVGNKGSILMKMVIESPFVVYL